jgi:CRISPR/Cas system-associated exonuclease Cas4 (RecB family)
MIEKKEVKHLSKSAIKEYMSCPFRFYNHKVLGIYGPTPYVFSRGINIHDTLHESIVLGKKTHDFQEQVNFTKALFKKLEPYSVVVAEKRMEAFYQDLKLVGLMDIVIQTGSKIIILDYKSGKDRPIANYRFELALYFYILKMHDITPTHWGIVFVDQQKVLIEEVKLNEVSKAMAKAYQTWLDIQDERYPRNLSSCKFCDLKDKCDYLWYRYNEEQKTMEIKK